jgi:hypothetical protein
MSEKMAVNGKNLIALNNMLNSIKESINPANAEPPISISMYPQMLVKGIRVVYNDHVGVKWSFL